MQGKVRCECTMISCSFEWNLSRYFKFLFLHSLPGWLGRTSSSSSRSQVLIGPCTSAIPKARIKREGGGEGTLQYFSLKRPTCNLPSFVARIVVYLDSVLSIHPSEHMQWSTRSKFSGLIPDGGAKRDADLTNHPLSGLDHHTTIIINNHNIITKETLQVM